MSEIVVEHTALADEEHQQLRLLVSKWQLVADLVEGAAPAHTAAG
jgi:hypothetical protein